MDLELSCKTDAKCGAYATKCSILKVKLVIGCLVNMCDSFSDFIHFTITALTEACQRRDLDSLKKAIARAKEVNFDHQLDLQLALANRLKDQLERIEKLRHSVLNLDTKTIAEIKTYSNPPDGVHQSMMATFILLGNTPKEVKVQLNFENYSFDT